jgi:hypothetical protein
MKEGNVMNWCGSRKKLNGVSFSECLTPKVYTLLYLATRYSMFAEEKKEKKFEV